MIEMIRQLIRTEKSRIIIIIIIIIIITLKCKVVSFHFPGLRVFERALLFI